MKVKYETIKDRIKKHVIAQIDGNGFDISTHAIRLFLDSQPLSYHSNKQLVKNACLKTIDYWDVRSVSSLLSIFPTVYPRLVNKPLFISYNDNMDWIVKTSNK